MVFFYLTDRPADAAWLAPDERNWLAERLEIERRHRETMHSYTVTQALVNPRVIGLGLVYFGAVATNYGLSFFLPQIVKAFGLNTFLTTVVAARLMWSDLSAWCGGAVAPIATSSGGSIAAFPLFVAAAGIAASTALDDPTLKMLSLCVAGFGIFALPAGVLDATDRIPVRRGGCRGIAVINSIGNLAGFAGPFAMGWIKDHTGSYAGGLLLLAALGIIAMGIVLMLGHDDALERAPSAAE